MLLVGKRIREDWKLLRFDAERINFVYTILNKDVLKRVCEESRRENEMCIERWIRRGCMLTNATERIVNERRRGQR